MEPEQILIVDDEESIRSVLSQFLADAGCKPRMAGTAEEALSLLTKESYAAAIVDIVLPGMDGLQLLQEIKRSSPDTEVVIMTSYASLGTAVEAIRNGAYDYLQKPFEDLDDVWATVRRALEKRALIRDLENSNRELLISVRRQKCLIGAGRAMSAITSLCEILDFFIGLVADELDVDRASILLLNEKTGEMKIAASRGLAEEVVQSARVKIGEGIAGWVAREGKPILVTDVETDPRIKVPISNTNFASFISAPIVLSVPIQLEEKVLGVINVTNRRSGVPFEEEDMAFLYSLAGQAAVSIESSRNYEELQEAYQSLKTTQKQLVEAERLNAVGQMAAGVAHDFNNLLSGILGSTQLLNVELNSPDVDISSLRSALELIENLSLQGAATVRRIQEYSRIRKDVPSETVDLNAVVKNVVDMTRTKWKDECESQGVHIGIRLELGTIPETLGNASELAQVVSNLIFNAVEAMPEGGELRLRTFGEGEDIRLEVSDTGIGMSKEVKEKIFEPFFTTKEKGQGLGTSVIYGIIARHKGEIKVASEEGSGSTVQISLPVYAVRKEEQPPAPKCLEKRDAGARVLIVDDGEINRNVFESYVSKIGHKPVQASNGKEALSIFELCPIDLVITDLGMPGMSGWEVAKSVKKINPNVPVILISGWAIQQPETRIKESGVDRILQKPCTMHAFTEAVETVLGARPGADTGEAESV
jgi:signal transduction histidine kinase/DNA-binding response OmpR family regulator